MLMKVVASGRSVYPVLMADDWIAGGRAPVRIRTHD